MKSSTLSLWLAIAFTLFNQSHASDPYDLLGSGHLSTSGFIKEKCVTGNIIEAGNQQLEFSYLGAQDATDTMREIFGKVTGKVDFFIFGGSASISITNRVSENTSTSSTTLRVRYDSKDLLLTSPVVMSQQVGDTEQAIIDTCGDGFVNYVKLGSDLFLTSRLYFRSRDEYNKFQAKVKIKIGFFKKTFTKTKVWEDHTKNAVFALEVIPNGGMTNALSNLLNEHPRYCKTDNIDQCFDTAEILFAYLFGENGYASDLNTSHMAVRGYEVVTYKDSSLFDLITGQQDYIDPGYAILETRLKVKLEESIDHHARLNAFLAVETDEAVAQGYRDDITEMEQNIDLINVAMDACYEEPEFAQCKAIVETTLSQLHPVIWN